jgi:hypothetical protein
VSEDDTQTTTEQERAPEPAVAEPAAPQPAAGDGLPAAAQRPEVLVAASFAGAFVLARILKRIFD